MSSISEEFVWEIPETDEELSDVEPLQVQKNVTAIDRKEEFYDYRRIVKFFPRGRGLLSKPLTAGVSGPVILPVRQELIAAPATKITQEQNLRGESDEQSESTSTNESSVVRRLKESTDTGTPATEEPEQITAGEESVSLATRRKESELVDAASSKRPNSSNQTETSSDDEFAFTQNPATSSSGGNDQERSVGQESGEKRLQTSTNESIEAAKSPEDDALHLHGQGAPVAEEKDNPLHAAAEKGPHAITEPNGISNDEPREIIEPPA